MRREKFRWSEISTSGENVKIGSGSDLAENVRWGKNVVLGNNVRIGVNTVLLDNVTVGDNVSIGPNCVIGELSMRFYRDAENYVGRPVTIGADSILRAGNIISEGVTLGEGFQSGPYVSIRENTHVGKFCSVGNYGDIQPDVEMGDYTRLHSNVHLTEGARVGRYVWIMPNCVFTNDNLFPVFTVPQPPTIGDYCVLGTGSVFYPDVKLGKHVVIAAGSRVKGQFGDFDFVSGDPAKRTCDARKFFVQIDGKFHFPYPWPKHITRNYPWKDVPVEERDIQLSKWDEKEPAAEPEV